VLLLRTTKKAQTLSKSYLRLLREVPLDLSLRR